MSKQLKISELKRVVNVDTITKHAAVLSDVNNLNQKQIESILIELGGKTPSKEVLMKTRLGFILKDLANREGLPKRTRNMANDLRQRWKDFHKRLMLAPKYDVKCDKPTSEGRMKAREFIRKTFLNANKSADMMSPSTDKSVRFDIDLEKHQQLVSDLEFKIFQFSDTLVNSKYFANIRKCMKLVSDDMQIRHNLLGSVLSANEFVLSCCLNSNTTNLFQATSSTATTPPMADTFTYTNSKQSLGVYTKLS